MYIRQASSEEAALVSSVLSAAAANLSQKGLALWGRAEVSEEAVKDQVRAGTYYVAFEGDSPVGVFRLDLEDRLFWPEVMDGSSAFIHKVAVHPHKQGRNVAHALLGHACELARQHGRSFLRLDCMGGRPKLRAVYERFGFRHHSDKKLGDRIFHRFEFEVGPRHGPER
jgi:GNAT superfamily N-acetyltransferase